MYVTGNFSHYIWSTSFLSPQVAYELGYIRYANCLDIVNTYVMRTTQP